MNIRRLNLFSFLLSVGAISYFHMKKCHELPWPPQFIYTGLVFVLLDFFAVFSEELAGVTSIGFVIGMFVKQGWIADCEHGGTGQPSTTAFMGNPQPPTTASIAEFQQQTAQGGTTGQQLPGTQLV